MQTDSSWPSREAVARDLADLATRRYGPEAAQALQRQIAETAGWIALVLEEPLDIWADEPDFLVAPQRRGG